MSVKLQFDGSEINKRHLYIYMNPFEFKQFYRRNRPHIHPPDSTLFVTFRLAGSIPKAVIKQYRDEKVLREREIDMINAKEGMDRTDERMVEFHRNWFRKFDKILDRSDSVPCGWPSPMFAV